MPSETTDLAVWQRACELLTLSDEHVAELRAKRGLSETIVQLAKLRSSRVENRSIFAAIREQFSDEDLLHSQLFIQARDGEIYPNALFCGRGNTGKEDDDGKLIRKDGLNPVLIPYLDLSGQPETVRPHKDFLGRPEDTRDDDTYTSQRVYCPYLLRSVASVPGYEERHRKLCVLTEGEFKQLALIQCAIPALAFPGIQAIANYPFQKNLIELLTKMSVTDVVIVFDNETKDDPDLKEKYKPDPWDRYDSIVYAIITARVLKREGFSARIGKLPDEWKENGKADWDGALARFVREAGGNVERGTVKARKEFLKVISAASERWKNSDLFPTQAEIYIEAKVDRHFHVYKCLRGDDRLQKLAARIRGENPALSAAMWECVGRYYERKPPKRTQNDINALRKDIETARTNKNFERATAIEQELLGFPKPLSNFLSDCDFRLIRPDGRTEYLVRFRDVYGNKSKSHVRVTSESASTLSAWRKLMLDHGITWKGGEKDLQDLSDDWQARSSKRAIHEIETYGFNEESGLWKFADRAFADNLETTGSAQKSRIIIPDKNMVFWHDGVGYQTDFRVDKLGDGFEQGAPILGDLNVKQASACFLLMTKHLFDALGDYTGWLLLGSMLAYAAHPEILKRYGGAPGIWLTGRKGSGKSTIAEWLMRIWGFPGRYVTLTAETTGVFVSREISKYEYIPAWFDEYREHTVRPEVKSVLHNAFNRAAGGKGTADSTRRTRSVRPGTTPIVTGETSCGDAATRSRYLNATALADRALGNSAERLAIMKSQQDAFRNIGHFLMLHRQEYSKIVLHFLDNYVTHKSMDEYTRDVRLRFVSGTPYAAWAAAAHMLEHHSDAPDLYKQNLNRDGEFLAFTREMTSETQRDTQEVSFIMQFWNDLMNILHMPGQSGVRSFVWLQYCRITNVGGRPCVATHQDHVDRTLTPALFLDPKPIYHIYEQEIRKNGRISPMSLGDIKRELSRERYWLKSQESQSLIIHDHGRHVCWAMNLLEHPLGTDFIDFFENQAKGNKSHGEPPLI